jgi:hypothetical protein
MNVLTANLFGAAALMATVLVGAPQYAHAQASSLQTSQRLWNVEKREAWIASQLEAGRKAGTISDSQYKTLSQELAAIHRNVDDQEALQNGGLADDQKDSFNAQLTALEAQLPPDATGVALAAQK